MHSLRGELQEFKITLRNKFVVFAGVDKDRVHVVNGKLTTIVTEQEVAVRGTEYRKDTGGLSQETVVFIQRRWNSKE